MGKGVDFETIDIKSDAFNSEYVAQLSNSVETLQQMSMLAAYLLDGNHIDAPSVSERLLELKRHHDALKTQAESYKFMLDQAMTRETALIKSQKMFQAQSGILAPG